MLDQLHAARRRRRADPRRRRVAHRRHRAPPRRAAGRVPGLPRPAHRAAQPHAAGRAPRAGPRARPPLRPLGRAALHRPRRLQARQRLVRPRRGRRAAVADRRAPARGHALRRPARAPGRRRVPAAPDRHRGRRPGRRRARGRRRSAPRSRRRSCCAAPRCRWARASASASSRATRRARAGCSSSPTSRCTAPRAPSRRRDRAAARRRPARAAGDDHAAAQRPGRRRVRPALAAGLLARRRAARVGRGAAALGRPRARPRARRRVHPDGRADGADRADRRLGRRRDRPPGARLARGRPRRRACRSTSPAATCASPGAARRDRREAVGRRPRPVERSPSRSARPARIEEGGRVDAGAARAARGRPRHRDRPLQLRPVVAARGCATCRWPRSRSTRRASAPRAEDEAAASLVTGIIGFATALGVPAVAEGVETEAQRRFLVDNGCPSGQGFHLAPPAAHRGDHRAAAPRARVRQPDALRESGHRV